MFTKEEIALAKATVEAIKKISKGKWEGKPEVGEWCIYKKNNEIALIVFHWPKTESNKYETLEVAFPLGTNRGIEEFADEFIPLLHWERIEEILEGMGVGYEVKIDKWQGFEREGQNFRVSIRQNGVLMVGTHRTKTRQLAVMRAVIELVKEK